MNKSVHWLTSGSLLFMCCTRLAVAQMLWPLDANSAPQLQSATEEMRERLLDPLERQLVVAQSGLTFRMLSHGFDEYAGIDHAIIDELAKLQTEQHLAQLDRTHGVATDPPPATNLERADQESAALARIAKFLGTRTFELYLDFGSTWTEREQLQAMEKRLPLADRLTPRQRQQLVALLAEDITGARALRESFAAHAALRRQAARNSSAAVSLDTTAATRLQQLEEIQVAEQALRLERQFEGALLARANTLLTDVQSTALAKFRAAERAWREQHTLQQRSRAGLAPLEDIAALLEFAGWPPKLLGEVNLELTTTLDRHARFVVQRRVANGSPVAFTAPDGLSFEATPWLFPDGSAQVYLVCYEHGPAIKRRILSSMSSLTQDKSFQALMRGRRTYSLQLKAQARAAT